VYVPANIPVGMPNGKVLSEYRPSRFQGRNRNYLKKTK
jgi:hypothetical protein